MKLQKLSKICAVILSVGVSSIYAASSDLACSEVDIGTYYSQKYNDSEGGDNYIYYNGTFALNITPPATSSDSKQLTNITSMFSSVNISADKTSIVFGAKNSANAYTNVLESNAIDVGIYYAQYQDSNDDTKYIYFNGSLVLDITPPATSSDSKQLTNITSEFNTLPVISTDGKLIFSALKGGTCDTTDDTVPTPGDTGDLLTPPAIPAL